MRQIRGILRPAIQSEDVLMAARAQALLRDWESIVGETLGKKSWPDRFSKGTVWVAVEGAAWATELRMRKSEILRRLNELAEDPTIFKDVRFGVRPLPVVLKPTEQPAPEISKPERDPRPVEEHLSIREIAERRLARWGEKGDKGEGSP